MAGTYNPIEKYLRDLPGSQKEITLSFEQIERILSDQLPPSAFKYKVWWSYERNPHQPEKQAIANAGWKMETINLSQKWVRLIRS